MSTSPIPPVLDQDRYAVYQPTAATTDFALGFPLFGEAADVAVYLDGSLLNLTSDYTIRSTANGATLTPAPVTDAYVRLNAPISAGKLEIFGNFRPRRTIQATAPYGTRDFNFAFSLLMAAMREMWTKFTRSLKVPVGEADLTIPNSEERAGQVFAFDEAGKPTIGGRYSDLMSSASAATVAAANALSSARAAAASAEAAARFDPASYSTTNEITALLESYVPATRTIASGVGVKVNGGENSTLSGTVTIGLDLATDAETIAGLLTNKPAAPSGVHAAIAAALGSISAIAPGIIGYTAEQNPPTGWLERNGAAISRTAYAALFAKISTTFGAGDGSTTFNLPDARGTFDRGWDHGRGLDPGRVFGSYQGDMFASHTHPVTFGGNDSGGYFGMGSSSYSLAGATQAAGGTETRPKNGAYLPIIKY